MDSKFDLVLSEMKKMNKKVSDIENNMATKQDLKKVTTKVEGLTTKVEGIEEQVAHVQEDITHIKTTINRIEETEPQDILAMLDRIDKKLDDKDSDIVVLNKRLFKVESTIERITNQ